METRIELLTLTCGKTNVNTAARDEVRQFQKHCSLTTTVYIYAT